MNRTLNQAHLNEASETLDILQELSTLLNCGLDKQTLTILVSLIENGVNPDALANVVKELRRESKAIKNQRKS